MNAIVKGEAFTWGKWDVGRLHDARQGKVYEIGSCESATQCRGIDGQKPNDLDGMICLRKFRCTSPISYLCRHISFCHQISIEQARLASCNM